MDSAVTLAVKSWTAPLLVILDNVSAHKSKRIKEYPEGCGGDVVLRYAPAHTPQQDPIEILRRELKRAVSDRYFEGGREQPRRTLPGLLETGEAPRFWGVPLR